MVLKLRNLCSFGRHLISKLLKMKAPQKLVWTTKKEKETSLALITKIEN
jgi:hypothetical protein